MYDLFVGDLICPRCTRAAKSGEHTAMQTHLRVDANGSALTVGFELDPFDLQTGRILRSGYLLVAPPLPGNPIRLLESWTCPGCETEQWGMVTIDQDRIQRMEAVSLDREMLERANFISDFAAENVARTCSDAGAGVVETLRRNLEPGS